jgi:hypothetical protein
VLGWMHARMDGWMGYHALDGCMHAWMPGWVPCTDAWMGTMHGCLDACMHAWNGVDQNALGMR